MNAILLILVVVLLIEVLILRRRVAVLERFREEVEAATPSPEEVRSAKQEPQSVRQQERPDRPPLEQVGARQSGRQTRQQTSAKQPEPAPQPGPQLPPRPPPPSAEAGPSSLDKAMETGTAWVRQFFTSGNVVLKIGLIILFFGVSFLLKYAAQRNLIPIELRLAGVASFGVALLVSGWLLAKKKAGYGLALQGGGIGIFYLTVFAAARLYQLVPYTLSFAVMVGVVMCSAVLAVRQNSKALAAFGALGGFAAPVLMSTGSGSHVVLFSYYALLNAGIASIAWFKSWRELNLIGFFFTFVISAVWGYRFYQPAYFATTEPFLVIFFLLYLAIAVLFAHRQPPDLRGFVDGPLVFGLPIAVFGMQASLVEALEYGVALSALAMSFVYILLAVLLWKRAASGLRTLTEAFLALGVVFGSLAIPFALEGHYTASAWALEGAAMVWVGLRQRRLLARHFGILLQVGAALALLLSPNRIRPEDLLFINQVSLSCYFVALGALFSAYQLDRRGDMLRSFERFHSVVLMGWGLLWWFGTGIRDIETHFPASQSGDYCLIYLALSALLCCLLQSRLVWHRLHQPLLGYLPVLVLAAFSLVGASGTHLFLEGTGAAAWPLCLAVLYVVFRAEEHHWPAKAMTWYHTAGLWLFLAVLVHDCYWLVDRLVVPGTVWSFVCLGVLPGCAVVLLLRFGRRVKWPVAAFPQSYLDYGVAAPLFLLVGWSIVSNTFRGDAAPLPYIPLLNPLTVSQLFVFGVLLYWHKYNRLQPGACYGMFPPVAWAGAFAVLVFLWLNGVTARLVSLYFSIPYGLEPLLGSVVFQAALSILWSVLALTVTVWATRRNMRQVWFVGAILLACVVVKLFLVELSGSGTVARIVSFIAVGLLMLLIGYFSPLPPRKESP